MEPITLIVGGSAILLLTRLCSNKKKDDTPQKMQRTVDEVSRRMRQRSNEYLAEEIKNLFR